MSSSLDFLYLLPPDAQNDVLNGPALAPPTADIVPNFEHPPNINPFARVITAIALVLVTIAVGLRAYAKVFIVKKVRLQDSSLDFALLAYLCFIGCCYSVYRIAAGVGFLVHQWNVTVRDLNGLIFSFQIAINFYVPAILFLKTSILLDWLQIFVPRRTRGPLFWTLHIIIWLNALFYASVSVAGNLSCIPFNRIWDKRIPGTCFDRTPLDLTSAGVNVVCDIVILLAPQSVIWRLQLTTARKIGVSVIFATGLLAISSAFGRLVATKEYSTSPDFTYEISKAGLWSLGELSFAFFVLCIPSLPVIFKESNGLSRMASSILSCSLLRSKTSDVSVCRNLQLGDEDCREIESRQFFLPRMPGNQATYQVSSAMEHAHLHGSQNDNPLTHEEGAITITREFTTSATRLSDPDSLYHTWHSNHSYGFQ
ncbi:hypothetical protein O1611_g4138 [Lasiodiplodia mahajangana]|uniref:Uncharacterized protein n=1 Tax=Lasiodiplodia mahajangana TaxID=1108764 RepID=A0ACC2JQH3_9PEZI|nr:hypothetical protein O1611_g4138 [Lasiodiplodia mahajangana]